MVFDDLTPVLQFFLRMIEESAVLTLEVTVSWREEMLVVAVVGMKLVPLLSREMASGGSDFDMQLWILFDEDSLIFADSNKVLRCD